MLDRCYRRLITGKCLACPAKENIQLLNAKKTSCVFLIHIGVSTTRNLISHLKSFLKICMWVLSLKMHCDSKNLRCRMAGFMVVKPLVASQKNLLVQEESIRSSPILRESGHSALHDWTRDWPRPNENSSIISTNDSSPDLKPGSYSIGRGPEEDMIGKRQLTIDALYLYTL
jgi:hypothetical protein